MVFTPSNVLAQRPETGINERWTWFTDVIPSDNNKEQRISTSPLPKRSWTGQYAFDSSADLRRHFYTMQHRLRNTFDLPLFHESVILKAPVIVGATIIPCNTARSDFRPLGAAFIVEGGKSEVVAIASVAADSVTLNTPVVNAYSRRAQICPLTSVYANDSAVLTRRGINSAGTSSFSFVESVFQNPFVLENDVEFLLFEDDYPILNMRPYGDEWPMGIVTGSEISDYGGRPFIRDRWLVSQWAESVSYLVNRGFHPEHWLWWRAFADYCQGSRNPFYLPTWRDDFELTIPAIPGGGNFWAQGADYTMTMFPQEHYRQIVFTTEAGLFHAAHVWAAGEYMGQQEIRFTPALPAGDWDGHTVSLLLKSRIADDLVNIEHRNMHSTLTLNIRTVT